MTPRQENSIERAVGRIEGQMDHLVAAVGRIEERHDTQNEALADVVTRLEKMEAHGVAMNHVADAFAALQQAVRDGKMQAKGIMIGIGLAAGAGGATIATGIKAFLAWLTGEAV